MPTLVDATDTLGVIVLREHGDLIAPEFSGMRIDKATAARLFYRLARELKAQHEKESVPPCRLL